MSFSGNNIFKPEETDNVSSGGYSQQRKSAKQLCKHSAFKERT